MTDGHYSAERSALPDLESFLHLPGWEHSDGIQLSSGPFQTTRISASLGTLDVLLNHPGVTLLDRGVYDGTATVVGMVLGGERAPRYLGPADLANTLMVWRPGKQDFHQYTIPRSCVDLSLLVHPSLIELMGWQLDQPLLSVPRGGELASLADTACAALSDLALNDGVTLVRSRLRIVAALDAVLARSTPVSTAVDSGVAKASSHSLLAEALTQMEVGLVGGTNLRAADDIAASFGVSRSTLFASFRHGLGLGPHRYLTILRLHELRKALLVPLSEEQSVTELAFKFGFTHLGRLPGQYREIFGELPSETLRRGKSKLPNPLSA